MILQDDERYLVDNESVYRQRLTTFVKIARALDFYKREGTLHSFAEQTWEPLNTAIVSDALEHSFIGTAVLKRVAESDGKTSSSSSSSSNQQSNKNSQDMMESTDSQVRSAFASYKNSQDMMESTDSQSNKNSQDIMMDWTDSRFRSASASSNQQSNKNSNDTKRQKIVQGKATGMINFHDHIHSTN